jgi:diguanylate cyclase (GGDEF)-like protein
MFEDSRRDLGKSIRSTTDAYRRAVLLCLVFCLTITTSLTYFLFRAYQQERSAAQTRTANTSLLVSEWIRGAFAQSDYVLRDIASAVRLDEMVFPAADLRQHALRSALINDKRTTVPYAFRVGLFDGRCIITHLPTEPQRIGFDASAFEHCQVLRDNPAVQSMVTRTFVAKIGNVLNVTQSRRLKENQPGFHGYAAFSIDLKFFASWLDGLSVGTKGMVAIVDTQRLLVASKPARPTLGQTYDFAHLQEFIGAQNQMHAWHRVDDVTYATQLVSYRRVPGLPFVVMVGEADDDWLAIWRQTLSGAVVTLLLLCGMAVVSLRHYGAVLRQREELDRLANTDALTSVANRRSFMEHAQHEINRAARSGQSLSLLMLDIDRFKTINDSFGHAAGDRAITAFAQVCQLNLRDFDWLSRLGGDEFAVLLPDTTKEQAELVAQRIRESVESCNTLNHQDKRIPITTSIGLAGLQGTACNVEALMAQADAALYQAKQQGRNRVVCA